MVGQSRGDQFELNTLKISDDTKNLVRSVHLHHAVRYMVFPLDSNAPGDMFSKIGIFDLCKAFVYIDSSIEIEIIVNLCNI